MSASGVDVPASAMLGADGGFEIMLGLVLAYFQVMNAGFDRQRQRGDGASRGPRHVHPVRAPRPGGADNPVARANVARSPWPNFLLSVLGEGTFLSLLSFLERFGPDPVTRRITHLALADEARHVAFGMAHMGALLATDPGLRARLATAVGRRHDALASTAGLNAEVFDALVVLAAGAFTPAASRRLRQGPDPQGRHGRGPAPAVVQARLRPGRRRPSWPSSTPATSCSRPAWRSTRISCRTPATPPARHGGY